MQIKNISPRPIVLVALSCCALFFASLVRAAPDDGPPSPKAQQAEGGAARVDNPRTATGDKVAPGGKSPGAQGKEKEKTADNPHVAEARLAKLQESVDALADKVTALNSSLRTLSDGVAAADSGKSKPDARPDAKSLVPTGVSLLNLFLLVVSLVVGPLVSWLLTRASLRRVGIL